SRPNRRPRNAPASAPRRPPPSNRRRRRVARVVASGPTGALPPTSSMYSANSAESPPSRGTTGFPGTPRRAGSAGCATKASCPPAAETLALAPLSGGGHRRRGWVGARPRSACDGGAGVLRQRLGGEQSGQQFRFAGDGAEGDADRHVVVRPVGHHDRVAGADLAGVDHPKVGAGYGAPGEVLDP